MLLWGTVLLAVVTSGSYSAWSLWPRDPGEVHEKEDELIKVGNLSFDQETSLQLKAEPQDAVFWVGYGMVGGYGDPVLMKEGKAVRWQGRSIVLDYDAAGLFDSRIGETGVRVFDSRSPGFLMSARVHMTLGRRTQSTNPPTSGSVWILHVDRLYDVTFAGRRR